MSKQSIEKSVQTDLVPKLTQQGPKQRPRSSNMVTIPTANRVNATQSQQQLITMTGTSNPDSYLHKVVSQEIEEFSGFCSMVKGRNHPSIGLMSEQLLQSKGTRISADENGPNQYVIGRNQKRQMLIKSQGLIRKLPIKQASDEKNENVLKRIEARNQAFVISTSYSKTE